MFIILILTTELLLCNTVHAVDHKRCHFYF